MPVNTSGVCSDCGMQIPPDVQHVCRTLKTPVVGQVYGPANGNWFGGASDRIAIALERIASALEALVKP